MIFIFIFWILFFFFSSRRRHTRWPRDWSSDVCSSDLRCGENGKIGWRRQRRDRVKARLLAEAAIFRIDEPNRPRKSAAPQILRHNEADAALLWAGADQRHGLGVQQAVKIANGHEHPPSRGCQRASDPSIARGPSIAIPERFPRPRRPRGAAQLSPRLLGFPAAWRSPETVARGHSYL